MPLACSTDEVASPHRGAGSQRLPGQARLLCGCWVFVACWLVFAANPILAVDAHPRVIGFERFHAADSSNSVAGGQLLLGELNCTSCHQADQSLETYIQKK